MWVGRIFFWGCYIVTVAWLSYGWSVDVDEGSQRPEYIYTCGREAGSTGERRDHMLW